MNNTRRLAAIMFTDIVGYTAMMQENEKAASEVRSRHREVFTSCHKEFHGEILQYYGDGTLSIFKSAMEAVSCAISMQQSLNEKVPLRIGLHVGDIVSTGSEVYGDGVNLASRVESLGVPGAILISDKVNYEIKNHDHISTQSIGHFEFKNIKDPVEVYAVSNSGIRVPDRSELKGKLKQNKKSIAVLPFVNISSDPENEYFSDGISEEILNGLVKVEGLQVTARTSSFAFKGKNLDMREIGRALGVMHLLEGSVRKAGNRVRITAQLISTVDGYHLFSETYDRDLEDIFAVQDEIAQKITRRLREHLGKSESETTLIKAPTDNLEAYEAYLKGLYYLNQWGYMASKNAKPYFEEAIRLQGDFALAHAMLGMCYLFFSFGGVITWAEGYEHGIRHAKRAIELDDSLAEAYICLGSFQTFFEWNWNNLRETIEIIRKSHLGVAQSYHVIATYNCIAGDLDASIEMDTQGLRLDPMSVQLNFFVGVFYAYKGDYSTANEYLDKVLEVVPDHRTAIEYKGWNSVWNEKYDEGLVYFNQIPEMGYRLHKFTCLGYVYFKMGEKEKANEYLDKLLELEKDKSGFSLTRDLAILYAGMENMDRAFEYLEKSLDNKIGDSMMFRLFPEFIPFRDDQRFIALEKKIGLDKLEPLG